MILALGNLCKKSLNALSDQVVRSKKKIRTDNYLFVFIRFSKNFY
jgi:hypothetical protein